jgi:hypothetical protein
MDTEGTEVTVEELPPCNFIHDKPEPALYDGKTIHGPWAFMCEEHFRMYGTGLGMGKGQRLVVKQPEQKQKLDEQSVRAWLTSYVWLPSHQDHKKEMVDCIISQGGWEYISARADQFAGAQEEPGPKAFSEGIQFALSELYECHTGPHLETCPDHH